MSADYSDKLYFCASHQSIDAIFKRPGIWYEMPYNRDIEPISAKAIELIGKGEKTYPAADMRIKVSVRLLREPSTYLKTWDGNIASVFLVEIDPKIFNFSDLLRVRRLKDGKIEYLKSHYVDMNLITAIYVYSQEVLDKLRPLIRGKGFRKPVKINKELFGKEVEKPDTSFAIKPYSPPRAPPTALPLREAKIRIIKGDLLKSKMQTLVNTVNCVGVMGKGIALAFKRNYPDLFKDYRRKCNNKEVSLGRPYLYRITKNRQIINFPTKGHWRENSKLEKIEEGLIYLVNHAAAWGIKSLAVPPLGCGNGKLDWHKVLPLMKKHLGKLEIPIDIYAPHKTGSFGELINHQSSSRKRRGSSSLASSRNKKRLKRP